MVYLALMRSVLLGSCEIGFRRIRVWRGHDGFHVIAPPLQLAVKSGHEFGLLAGEIIFLSDVVAQVEQLQLSVLVPFDQFPIAVANRAVRCTTLVAVMWVMPEKRAARELPALQQRFQTHAVRRRE